MRKASAIVALFACFVYAIAFPWHVSMRMAAATSPAASASTALNADFATSICHGGSEVAGARFTLAQSAGGHSAGSRPAGAELPADAASPAAEDDGQSAPHAPRSPSDDCELCKSLAGMSLALLAAAELGLLEPPTARLVWAWASQSVGDLVAVVPRNRGPPAIV